MDAQSGSGANAEHVRAQDKSNSQDNVCALCDKQVNASDAVAYIAGRPQHSECRAKAMDKPAEEKQVEEVERCKACCKPVENRSMSVMVSGGAWHQACFAEFGDAVSPPPKSQSSGGVAEKDQFRRR